MTPRDFVYWLQGYAEVADPVQPTPQQWRSIKEHLYLVLTKETPHTELSPLVRHMERVQDKLREELPDWQKKLLSQKITC